LGEDVLQPYKPVYARRVGPRGLAS
jgi:hypothetical protein